MIGWSRNSPLGTPRLGFLCVLCGGSLRPLRLKAFLGVLCESPLRISAFQDFLEGALSGQKLFLRAELRHDWRNSPFEEDLLLEKIVKRRARVGRFGAYRSRRLFFRGDPDRVKRAGVLHILARDPLRNGLHAFEAARRIEVRALLAGVQLKPALRTLLRHFP